MRRAGAALHTPPALAVLACLALGGCVRPAPPPADCQVLPSSGPEGKRVIAVHLVMRNTGQWCGAAVLQPNGTPYRRATLSHAPVSGQAVAKAEKMRTLLAYRPKKDFTGRDSFTARLEPGGRVAVTDVLVVENR